MQYLLDELLSELRFDLLQIEDNAMLGTYRYRTEIPGVYTDHEVRSTARSNRRCRSIRGTIQWLLTEAERRRWQQYQSTVWRRFDRIQVFTPRDAAVIRTIAPELADRVRINPFGIEVPAEADPSREQAGTIVFVGGFGHPPNIDAALWLGNEIMPLLRTCWPGIRLMLVGSYPPKAVKALASNDTIVTGRVSMVEPFLEQAAVVIAPLRTGGGMRVKVLQAMALGKAVVTTPLGAEGLSVACSQPPLAIAETTEEIARITAALLASQAARRTLGCRARAHIMQYYTWSSYGHRLEEIYAELLSEGRAK
jgi:glycosyltransferase involved in cell wall biosynthesis